MENKWTFKAEGAASQWKNTLTFVLSPSLSSASIFFQDFSSSNHPSWETDRD
jgi:hypothetical protein